jgi:parvulin-like peptidyl-prolyl isomerase
LGTSTDVGTELAEASRQQAETAPGFADLQESTQNLIVDYFIAIDTLPQLSPPEEEIAAWFNRGPESAGIACVSHILVETPEEADAIVSELRNGAEFADLAADRSIDGSAESGGFLSCTATDEILAQFVTEFAEAAVAAIPGVPTDPVQSEFGYHIIRNGTFEEHSGELAPLVAQGRFAAEIAIDKADVYVNPRYGSYDSQAGDVVPLG